MEDKIQLTPTIDTIFGSCKGREAVIILAGPSLKDFMEPLGKVLWYDRRTKTPLDVLVCNNWKEVRNRSVWFGPTWIFLLDKFWCKELLNSQTRERPYTTFVTMYKLDARKYSEAKIYSETYGEWPGFPAYKEVNRKVRGHRRGKYSANWDRVTLYNSGPRIIQMAWKLGYEKIHVFGWTGGKRKRYDKHHIYSEEPHLPSAEYLEQQKDSTIRDQRLFDAMGKDKSKLIIYEHHDHSLYQYAKECFYVP